ncbi:MAG: hypothetical protein HKN56_07085 [Gammaproteobacteria bacterium]|nr:hypothetical protein [Gammaproteobacteria bacterium]NND54718.1 hypothetical protein [Gammaproteobacteria bacterium]
MELQPLRGSAAREAFQRDGVVIVDGILDPYFREFLQSYYRTVREHSEAHFGRDWTSMNGQGDACSEAVLYTVRSHISDITELDLLPSMSVARMFEKGDKVGRHIDGPTNEINCTLCIDRDSPWYLHFENEKVAAKVDLLPGQAVLYRGNELFHWREKYTGSNHVQVIFGYVLKGGAHEDRAFERRGRPEYAPAGRPKYGPRGFVKARLYRLREWLREWRGILSR